MEPKIVTTLLGYHPNMVPENPKDIPQFLSNELEEIAYPLTTMANSWEPSISAGMSNPLNPTTVEITPTPIIEYQAERLSRYAPYLNITLDPIAGTISMGGPSNSRYTVQVIAFFSIGIVNVAQNQEMFLYVTDGVDVWTMGNGYVSEPNQGFLSIGSVRLLDVPADSVLNCYLILADSAGTVTQAGGEFNVNVLDSYEPEPVA